MVELTVFPTSVEVKLDQERTKPLKQQEIVAVGSSLIRQRIIIDSRTIQPLDKEARLAHYEQNPGMAVLQLMDTLMATQPDKETGHRMVETNWTEAGKKPQGMPPEGGQLSITLGEGAIPGHQTLNRIATVNSLIRTEGDMVVCMVEVPTRDNSEVAIPSREMRIPRAQLFFRLFETNMPLVQAIFSPEQQALVAAHLAVLKDDFNINDEEAVVMLEKTAASAGLITVNTLRKGYTKGGMKEPVNPSTKYQELKADWQVKKDADPNFNEPEPPAPDQTDLKYYNDQLAEYNNFQQMDQLITQCFGEETVASPQGLAQFLRITAEPQLRANRTAIIQPLESDMETLEARKKTLTEQIEKGVFNPNSQKMEKDPNYSETVEVVKELTVEIEAAKAQLELVTNLLDQGLSETQLAEYFANVQNGNIDPIAAQATVEAFSAGDMESVLKQLMGKMDKMRQEKGQPIDDAYKARISKMQHYFKIWTTTGKVTRFAAIGFGMVMVLSLMQGMGGGGQQG